MVFMICKSQDLIHDDHDDSDDYDDAYGDDVYDYDYDDNCCEDNDDGAGYIMGSCLVSNAHSLMPSHAIHDDRFRPR